MVGLTCIFGAVEVLPLADVMAVVWSSPLFALVFAAWFLRERVDGARWVAAVVGFAGVVVIMRPGPSTFEPMVLLALGAAILTGAEVVTVRLLAVKDTGLTVLAINNAVGAVLACSVAVFFFMMPSGAQLLALAGVGVVTLAGQALFLQALRIAATSAVVPFCYSTLIWAALIGVLVFDKLPSWHFYLGASLIIAGGVFVTWRGERG
jgi:drug/metabolite transporter (DMT)-like permease